MELNGYVKLYRKLVQWEWYKDNVVKSLFLHCLISASFKDFSWMGNILKAGQFITSVKHLSEELGFSTQQIRTALKKLESTGELTSKSTNKFTIITVNKWEDYQSDEEPSNTQSNNPITNEQQTNNNQITNNQQHRKNVKNVKNVKKSNNACACAHTRVPQLSEILSFIAENNLNVNGEDFFNHYEDNGWVTKAGKPVTNWKQLVRVWSRRELREAPCYVGGYSGVKNLGED